LSKATAPLYWKTLPLRTVDATLLYLFLSCITPSPPSGLGGGSNRVQQPRSFGGGVSPAPSGGDSRARPARHLQPVACCTSDWKPRLRRQAELARSRAILLCFPIVSYLPSLSACALCKLTVGARAGLLMARGNIPLLTCASSWAPRDPVFRFVCPSLGTHLRQSSRSLAFSGPFILVSYRLSDRALKGSKRGTPLRHAIKEDHCQCMSSLAAPGRKEGFLSCALSCPPVFSWDQLAPSKDPRHRVRPET
jgi:hypothetical protein